MSLFSQIGPTPGAAERSRPEHGVAKECHVRQQHRGPGTVARISGSNVNATRVELSCRLQGLAWPQESTVRWLVCQNGGCNPKEVRRLGLQEQGGR